MATLAQRIAITAVVAGCSDLHGLESMQLTPLATLHVRVTGDIDAVRPQNDRPPRLRVALIWGQPWLPDASCLPPFETEQHAAVAAHGCDDPLGFRRAGFEFGEDAAIAPDGTATLDLFALPTALFGDTSSQIAYGSLVVYDDVNDDSSLEPFGDVQYGASFSSMTRPDTRVSFRHGGFDDHAAYYPRRGCTPPMEGFSLLSAGGFTLEQAIEAQARGELPLQDPASCREDQVDREVAVELRPSDELSGVGCFAFAFQFSPPPPFPLPEEPEHAMACTSIPDFGTGRGRGRSQLLTSDDVRSGCKFLNHYLLRGCYGDPLCDVPDWNVPAPSWWPCPPDGAP
jgi:hypothetical protein